MANQLPHSDPDLQLARHIEKMREQGHSISELDDPLLPHLLNYKGKKMQIDVTNSGKQAVWGQIVRATKTMSKTPVFTFPATNIMRWAAAAVLLVAAIFSYVYLYDVNQPIMVAMSNQAIKTVTLDDGSTVTLRPHSKLFSVDKETSKTIYKLEGEALFDVTHNPERTFTVKTQEGAVTVLGTRFILSSWGRQMQVYLQRGRVKVKASKTTDSAILQPGQAAIIAANKPINVIEKASVQTFTDWMSQLIIFTNEPAFKIMSELEQQFNISITLPPNVAKQKISGELSLKSLQPVLDNLALVLNGSFNKTSVNNYTFKAKPR